MSPKVTPLDKHIAGRIRAVRKERQMTQPSVAGVLGVSYQSYQKMERGAVSFRASSLDKMAALFGVPVSYFFEDAPAPAMGNGAEISCVVNIMRNLSAKDASYFVDQMARARGG